MKTRILLINPWIYDFAAANLWARPLGLLKVAELLSCFDVGLALIDCTDVQARRRYPKEILSKPDCIRSVPRRFGRYGISADEFIRGLKEQPAFDLIFITSVMSYWYPGVQLAIEIVRSLYGNVPVVLGGIYATLWHKHASETSGADMVCKGPVGKEGLRVVCNTLGFRLRHKKEQATPYYRLGLYREHAFAPLLTATGCPFSCSYCASNILNTGYKRTAPDIVVSEIQDLYRMGVRDFAFYDDALLLDAESHLKVILKETIRIAPGARFHCPNGLHARLVDDEIAYLMKKAGFRTLRLSLETVDQDRQRLTGGKVSTGDLRSSVAALMKHGFTKKEIGVYLMYGLPGQSLEEVTEGTDLLMGLGVSINLTEFSPIPGTGCWHELVSAGTIPEDIDPLLTNNTVFSLLFSGYDMDRLNSLKLKVKKYNIAEP